MESIVLAEDNWNSKVFINYVYGDEPKLLAYLRFDLLFESIAGVIFP
jgi:hypothetical protein